VTESEVQAHTIAAPRVRETWDTVLTIVFLVSALIISVIGSALGASLIMVTDGCGATNCDGAQMGTGIGLAAIGPLVVFAIVLVCSIVFLVKRRRAFWLPLVGMPVSIVLVVIGANVFFSGNGSGGIHL